MGKIPTALLIMNECITSKRKPLKLTKGQHFFGFQLARAAPVLLLRATGVSSTSYDRFSKVLVGDMNKSAQKTLQSV